MSSAPSFDQRRPSFGPAHHMKASEGTLGTWLIHLWETFNDLKVGSCPVKSQCLIAGSRALPTNEDTQASHESIHSPYRGQHQSPYLGSVL